MVGNAIKFTPAGGSVRVSARLDDRTGDLLMMVSDTGIGIADGDLQRAFEPFVQLDASLARRFPGSGLGLYVSRITARAHGGELVLSSQPDVGTTAVLRLPRMRLPRRQSHPCLIGHTDMTLALSALATTDRLFFERDDAALDRDAAERIVTETLGGCDDGELFLEYRESEQISLDDGRIRHAGFESGSGFGLRAIVGEETGYAHAGEVSEPALRRAAATVSGRARVRGRCRRRAADGRAMPGSMPTSTRWARWISAPARRSWRRSTPTPAPRIRASSRSWPACMASGRRCR